MTKPNERLLKKIMLTDKERDELFTKYEQEDPYQETEWDIIIMKALLAKADPIIRAEAYKEVGELLEAYLNEQIRQCIEGMKRTADSSPSAYDKYGVEKTTLRRVLTRIEALKQGKKPDEP